LNLLRKAATISGLTMLSRITGLVRDLLMARLFGAGIETDAFSVAFRLPNLLRRLFAEGAFSQAFVPVLAEVRTRDGDERTRVLFGHVVSALFWTLFAVSVAGVVGAPVLVWIIAGGFSPAAFDLATLMTRWMFPYILFMSLVACSAGVLNTMGHFAVPAVTPVLLNLSFIGCALLLAPHVHPPVMALAFAVVIGGVLQLAIQLPALARIGMVPRLSGVREAFADPQVRRVMRQMGPAVFAVSVAQLSLIINTRIASSLGEGAPSWLWYADRLMEFPTALLGVALGTVLLPSLSRAHGQGRADDYSRLLDWGLRLTLLLAAPAAIGLGLLATGLISVLFQSTRFDGHDVAQTAVALSGYAVGLVGLIGVKILAPGYFAQQDMRTPVKVGVVVLVVTQASNLLLVPRLAHAGLAWSISVGALLNAAVLFVGLRRRGVLRVEPGWGGFLWRLALALALLTVALVLVEHRVDWVGLQHAPVRRALALAGLIVGGAGIYLGALALLGLRPRQFMMRAT
jgi:putative peptidoglycan lipid II flippase